MRMVIVVALAATAPHAALAASAAGSGNSEFVKNLVATLEASANSGGLRTIDPSEINTIVLQDHLIQDSRRQMAAGTLDKDLGERVIATCEEAIRRFIHSVGNEALAIADSGRASDAARLGKTLGTLLSVTRQQILLGHEDDLALDGAKQIKALIKTYADAFARTCHEQQYSAGFALAFARQVDLLGIDNSVMSCMGRGAITSIAAWDITYTVTVQGQGESESDDGLDKSSWQTIGTVSGTATLGMRVPIPGTTMWIASPDSQAVVELSVDELHTSFSHGPGEGGSFEDVTRTTHAKGAGKSSVKFGGDFELKSDGTFNVLLPVQSVMAMELATESVEEWHRSAFGFGDEPQHERKASQATAHQGGFTLPTVPGLMQAGVIHHTNPPQLDASLRIEFETDWVDPQPRKDRPSRVHVSYKLLPHVN